MSDTTQQELTAEAMRDALRSVIEHAPDDVRYSANLHIRTFTRGEWLAANYDDAKLRDQLGWVLGDVVVKLDEWIRRNQEKDAESPPVDG